MWARATRKKPSKLLTWQRHIKPSPDRFQIIYGQDLSLQTTPQVALGLFLKPIGWHASLLVTCLHLKARPKETPQGMSELELKERQCRYFLSSVLKAAKMWSLSTPVLCAGDFNLPLTENEDVAEVVHQSGLVDTYGYQSFDSQTRTVDFILATSADVERVKAVLEVVLDRPCSPDVYPSDHLLRATELSIRASPPTGSVLNW